MIRALRKGLDRFRQDHGSLADRRGRLGREVAEVQARKRNLARAIAARPFDGAPDALLGEL